jgi:hypothetical protein
MRRNRFCLSIGRTAKAVVALFAVVVVLVLGALAVSPSLHKCIHADCDHPAHFCIVSAFATGQLGLTETLLVILTIASVCLFCGVMPEEAPLASCLNFYSSPNRAPPRL